MDLIPLFLWQPVASRLSSEFMTKKIENHGRVSNFNRELLVCPTCQQVKRGRILDARRLVRWFDTTTKKRLDSRFCSPLFMVAIFVGFLGRSRTSVDKMSISETSGLCFFFDRRDIRVVLLSSSKNSGCTTNNRIPWHHNHIYLIFAAIAFYNE